MSEVPLYGWASVSTEAGTCAETDLHRCLNGSCVPPATRGAPFRGEMEVKRPCSGTSLTRKRNSLEPYRRSIQGPREVLMGVGVF